MKKIITSSWFMIIIQGMASLLLGGVIYKLNVLPDKYLYGVFGVLAVLVLCTYAFLRKEKKRNKIHIFGRLFSLFITVVLVVASVYAIQMYSFVGNISGVTTEYKNTSIVVLADTEAEEITDLENKKIGYVYHNDEDMIDLTITRVEEEITFESVSLESTTQLIEYLYNGEVDAVVLNEAYRDLLLEQYSTFSDDTKVIATYDIEVEIEELTKYEIDVTSDAFSVYISGIDTYGAVNTVSRSDVNMIVTINPTTKEILLTSIPRDTYVPLYSFDGSDKLTHTGLNGINETVNTVSNWLDVDIQYYARVNFTSLTTLVDALGGIEVYSIESFTTTGGVSVVAGTNYFDGTQALAFSRERYNVSGGDFGRGQNQMRVVEALIDKLISPTIISNYTSVLNAMESFMQTNMSADEITSLIKMQLDDMSGWNITTQQIEGSTQTGGLVSYYMPGYNLSFVVASQDSMDSVRDNIIKVLED